MPIIHGLEVTEHSAPHIDNHCRRQAITVDYAYEHLCDETTYMYSDAAQEMGLDPWKMITGIDRSTQGNHPYILEYGRTGEKVVEHNYIVYVPMKTLKRLGLM